MRENPACRRCLLLFIIYLFIICYRCYYYYRYYYIDRDIIRRKYQLKPASFEVLHKPPVGDAVLVESTTAFSSLLRQYRAKSPVLRFLVNIGTSLVHWSISISE